jgi:hypothetical protein
MLAGQHVSPHYQGLCDPGEYMACRQMKQAALYLTALLLLSAPGEKRCGGRLRTRTEHAAAVLERTGTLPGAVYADCSC